MIVRECGYESVMIAVRMWAGCGVEYDSYESVKIRV